MSFRKMKQATYVVDFGLIGQDVHHRTTFSLFLINKYYSVFSLVYRLNYIQNLITNQDF